MPHSKSMLTIHIHQYQNTMFISYTYMYVMYTNKTDKYFDFNFLISSNISTLFEITYGTLATSVYKQIHEGE